MGITRRDGYCRAAGKGERGLKEARIFLRDTLGLESEPITDAHENMTRGDLRLAHDVTIEVKSQPINPDRYRRNFVEVFEETRKQQHQGGLARLLAALGMAKHEYQACTYRDRDGTERTLAEVSELVNPSLAAIAGSTATLYINCSTRGWVYLYASPMLVQFVRTEVQMGGLRRGLGNSNEDTFAVLVPIAAARWRRHVTGWQWAGDGDAGDILAAIAAGTPHG